MNDDIHRDIKTRLECCINTSNIPHMIFHGPSGGGKRTLVNWFLRRIYNNQTHIMNQYIMYVDCAHGKGIKFIREQVKFFAKTNLKIDENAPFKAIVLSNADKLTTDAQSALRRIIEIFSHSTRFFVIVEEKYRMMLPILSRLSDIYVPLPIINGKETNLNVFRIDNIRSQFIDVNAQKIAKNRKIGTIIRKHCAEEQTKTLASIVKVANECYDLAISCDDIINYLDKNIGEENKSKMMLWFDKIRSQYRSEPLLITTLLYYGLVRSKCEIVNVGFM